jgi:hypothetical protein
MSYLGHGRRHLARGSDPVYTDWYLLDLSVGDWSNIGSPKPDSRWCFLPGVDPATGDPHFEIELSVTGGTPASLIATLPFTLSTDKPVKAGTDSSGAFRAYTVKADGSIIDGAA